MTRVFNKMKTLMACSALATIALSPSVQAELASDLQDGVSALMTQSKWTGAQRQRSLTIMHLAMFDAANATQGVYGPYAYAGKIDTSASPQAAVTQAALSVMQELLPERQQDLEQDLLWVQ